MKTCLGGRRPLDSKAMQNWVRVLGDRELKKHGEPVDIQSRRIFALLADSHVRGNTWPCPRRYMYMCVNACRCTCPATLRRTLTCLNQTRPELG